MSNLNGGATYAGFDSTQPDKRNKPKIMKQIREFVAIQKPSLISP